MQMAKNVPRRPKRGSAIYEALVGKDFNLALQCCFLQLCHLTAPHWRWTLFSSWSKNQVLKICDQRSEYSKVTKICEVVSSAIQCASSKAFQRPSAIRVDRKWRFEVSIAFLLWMWKTADVAFLDSFHLLFQCHNSSLKQLIWIAIEITCYESWL